MEENKDIFLRHAFLCVIRLLRVLFICHYYTNQHMDKHMHHFHNAALDFVPSPESKHRLRYFFKSLSELFFD